MTTGRVFAFAAGLSLLASCGQRDDVFEMPSRPEGPLPTFTPEEKRNIGVTLAFLECAVAVPDAIIASPFYEAALELCAAETDFTLETFGDFMRQYQNRYGDAWPHMVDGLLETEHRALTAG